MDDLASDSRIAELYDLWYQQRERIIQTYSSHLPERVPLSQNEEFKAVRNAVVKAAVGIEYQKGIQTEDYKRARELLYGTDDAVPDPIGVKALLLDEAAKGSDLAMYDLGLMA